MIKNKFLKNFILIGLPAGVIAPIIVFKTYSVLQFKEKLLKNFTTEMNHSVQKFTEHIAHHPVEQAIDLLMSDPQVRKVEVSLAGEKHLEKIATRTDCRELHSTTEKIIKNNEIIGKIGIEHCFDDMSSDISDLVKSETLFTLLQIIMSCLALLVFIRLKVLHHPKLDDNKISKPKAIRNILDNVPLGLLLIDHNFEVIDGYSKSCIAILNTEKIKGEKLTKLLKLDPQTEDFFLAFGPQVFDDIFPEDIILEQLPNKIYLNNKTIKLVGKAIRDKAGKIESILFSIFDLTELEKAEKTNQHNLLILNILRDLNSFKDFVIDFTSRIKKIKHNIEKKDEPTMRRDLHTLKGNSSVFGLDSMVKLIHSMESLSEIKIENINTIDMELNRFLLDNYFFLKINVDTISNQKFEISKNKVEETSELISKAKSAHEALDIFNKFRVHLLNKPISELTGPLSLFVKNQADQMFKKVNFVTKGDDIYVKPEYFKDFLANLQHLISNAISHGIEYEYERAGKTPIGTIKLEFSMHDHILSVILEDDGHGIDDEKVVKKALEMQFITVEQCEKMTKQEKFSLIFLDNLSTAAQTDEISGRGIGMSAVLASIKKLNGTITIDSEAKKGTRFTILIPDQIG